MRNQKFHICNLAVLLVAGTLFAEYIPVGYEYNAPTGTLLLSQDYGSGAGKAGQGTWSGTATIVLNEDSMSITAASWSYLKTLLPVDVGDNPNVVDICIKGWSSPAASTSDALAINESCATWGAKYAFYLRTSGTLNPVTGKGSGTAAVPEDTGTIIRMVRTISRSSLYVLAGDNSETYVTATTPSGWGASDSSIVINSGLSGANTIEIAWMKVYSGTDASALTAPLTASVPEPATLACIGLGSFLFVLRKKK